MLNLIRFMSNSYSHNFPSNRFSRDEQKKPQSELKARNQFWTWENNHLTRQVPTPQKNWYCLLNAFFLSNRQRHPIVLGSNNLKKSSCRRKIMQIPAWASLNDNFEWFSRSLKNMLIKLNVLMPAEDYLCSILS